MSAVAIRPAALDDASALAAIYAHYVEHSVSTFEEVAPDAAEMAARIAAVLPAYPWLVATRSGRIVGYAYGRPYHARAAYRWTVETAIYLAHDQRRTGAARPLYEALLDELADRGFVSAIAVITVPNRESTRFHEKHDFVAVGTMEGVGFKHGAWRNVGYYQLALGPRSVPPPVLAGLS